LLSEDKKKPQLPEVDSEGNWTATYAGKTYRFREATIEERTRASKEALANPPYSEIDEQVHLFALILKRKNKEDKWENVNYLELGKKGEMFLRFLSSTYGAGLVAKALKVEGFLEASNDEPKPQKSTTSTLP